MKNLKPYLYIIVFSGVLFLISFLGAIFKDFILNNNSIKSLNNIELFIYPIIMLIIGGIVGYFHWKGTVKARYQHFLLKKSEYNYRSLFENMHDVVVILNEERDFVDVNAAAEELFEYPKAELLKMNVSEIVYNDDISVSNKHFDMLSTEGYYNLYEGRIRTKSGKIKWIQVNSRKIENEDNVIFFQDIIRDVTSKKEFEEELKETNDKLYHTNATKDRLFSTIAHDLRAPFTSILGFADILAKDYDKFDDTRKKHFLSNINSGLIKAYKLMDNLLSWARSETGELSIDNNKKIVVSDIVIEALELYDLTIKEKNLNISNNIGADSIVRADKNMLATVIRNLLSNAIKFTPNDGQIELNSKIQTIKSGQPEVVISVKDSGIGIPDHLVQNIFTLSATKVRSGIDNEEGAGLGLIICKEFITKMNGNIWVESTDGAGCEFFFSLPSDNSISNNI